MKQIFNRSKPGARRGFYAAALLVAALLAWLPPLGGAVAAGPVNDGIYFANGDRLRGELITFDPEKGLLWRHPDAAKEMTARTASVMKVRLGERAGNTTKPAFPVLVRLINQDELEGSLVAVLDDKIILQTWYAGELGIPRSSIESIVPQSPRPGLLFEGPTGLEGWTQGKPPIPDAEPSGWVYHQGAFLATQSASIARDFKLPNLVDIQFDVAWKGFFNLAIALYADSLFPINLAQKENAPDFGGFYSLQLNNNSVNILVVSKQRPITSLGAAFMPLANTKNSMHVAIRVNKPDQTINLLIDGALVKQWKEPTEFAGTGTILRFVNQTASIMKLSNLTVAEWDGRMDATTNKAPDPKSDFVLLMNNDTVAGRLQKFADGKLTVESPLGPLAIPLLRVAQVRLAETARPAGAAAAHTPQAFFVTRGRVTVAIERVEQGQLVGKSPLFGPVKITLGALKLLQLQAPTETAEPF